MLTRQVSKSCPEELIIYGLLVVIGVIPVITAMVQRTAFGVEATVGLLMVGAGMLGALVCAWRSVFPDRDS